jgi:nucleotide-binding universal stress UspA family protein
MSAVRTGAFLAQQLGLHVHLLHVAYAPSDWDSMPVEAQQKYPEIETLLVEAEIKLDKFASGPMFKNLNVSTFVYSGVPYNQIVQFARTYKMDLIVMGAHGAGETAGLFVGSTAQRVIRMAHCPVLSVKKEYAPKSLKNIVFPSDFEEDVGLLVNSIKGLANSLEADISFLYVNTPLNFSDTSSTERRMLDFLPSQNGVKFNQYIYNDFDKEKGILNFAHERNMDLIAMVTHDRTAKPNYQLGTTETLLFHSDVPVLSMIIK